MFIKTRGVHWRNFVGEEGNRQVNDPNAVAVYQEFRVVGHVPVPRNLAPRVFHFLARDTCKAFVEVTGKRVNRGAGYGLENPCTYRLYSPPAYIKKIDGLRHL